MRAKKENAGVIPPQPGVQSTVVRCCSDIAKTFPRFSVDAP